MDVSFGRCVVIYSKLACNRKFAVACSRKFAVACSTLQAYDKACYPNKKALSEQCHLTLPARTFAPDTHTYY